MSIDARSLASALPRPTVRSVAGAPIRLQTYRNLVYLALAFPLGLAYFVFLAVGLGVSAGFTVLLVGIPMFLSMLVLCIGLAVVERKLTAGLLGVDISPPEWSVVENRGVVGRLTGLLTDLDTWKALLYLGSKFVFGLASLVVTMTLLATSWALIATPLYYSRPGVRVGLLLAEPLRYPLSLSLPWQNLLVGVEYVVNLTSWHVDTLPEALAMSLLGVAVLVGSLNVLNALAWVSGQHARFLLGRSDLQRSWIRSLRR